MQVKSYQEGDLINTIEGRQYYILSEIGSGGSSKVYKADEVVNNSNHLVILKDFSASKQMMSVQQRDDYIQRELFINRKITEAEFPGALTIDYAVHDADNTHTYGVMTQVPKGATLREYVYSEAYKYTTLRDRVLLAKKVFTLIKNFHDTCKMVHGDISPDNIYVLSTGNELEYEQLTLVNLLDFGNAQMIGDEDLHSIKAYTAGYASAEKFSGETLTVLEDWYAALACFWFCLSGSSPDEYEVTDEHIAKVHGVLSTKAVYTNFYISGDVEQNNFISVRQKQYDVVENLLGDIFSNMHHVTDDVIEKVEGLLNILDETGISRERLFASLEEEYHTLRKSRFSGLDIIRRILPNVEFKLPRSSTKYYRSKNSRGELLQYIMNSCQDSLFMVGDGGMGKTTTLLNIMDETYNFSKERRLHPTVFLELCTLSQNVDEWYDNNEGGTFIEQFVASYFTKTPRRYLERNHPYVTALHEEFYRGSANGKKQYTIFLDGLNEIGFISERSRKVFFDTLNHYLQYAKNLRIVITGRNDAYELSKEYLQRLYTEGLDDLTIESVLNEAVQKDRLSHYEFRRIVNNRNEISSNEYRLWQCLKIPFFLMMYCMMSEKNNVTRQGEILKNFFHDKRETLNGEQVYGEKIQSEKKHRDKQYGEVEALRMDLSIRVILDFIIPEIALYMAFSNHYFISKEEILNVIHEYLGKNVSETQFQNWRKWYYGYETDVTNILSEINNIDNGDKIPEYACDMLGIMRFNANGAFFFTHQHFRDYFAACAYINRILLTLETTKHNADVYYAWEPKFHEFLEPFESKMLPNYIAAPIGEILGECHNVSCFDATRGEWKCSLKQREEQRVLERLFDRYRNHPNMENDKKASMGLKNILEILKHSRVQNDGKIDFAGVSFRNLDLRGVSLGGIAMSRFGFNKALVADFTDSKGVVSALLKDDAMQKVECLAVHTLHNHMLLYSPMDNTLSEVDLEHSETKTLAVNIGVVYCAFYEQNGGILFVVQKENSDYSYQVCYLPQGAEEWSSTDLKNVKVLGGEWSEELQELSLATLSKDGQVLQIQIFQLRIMEMGTGGKKPILISQGTYYYPDTFQNEFQITEDSFMLHRINQFEYLISDYENWNGLIGRWNVKTKKVSTFLCFEDKEHYEQFSAYCKCSQKNEIYCLNRYNFEKRKYDNGNNHEEAALEFSLNVIKGNRIEILPFGKEVLLLKDGELSLWNREEKEYKWKLAIEVTNYFYANGYIIANCKDGVYRIDLSDGNATCYQRFVAKQVKYKLGQTNTPHTILLYENNGTLKWIDVHTGCSVRHTFLQVVEGHEFSFYADDRDRLVFGNDNGKIYCWDENTGMLQASYSLSYNSDEELLWSEFVPCKGALICYFVKRDYEKFPLKKTYVSRCWNFAEQRWFEFEIPWVDSKIHDEPYRLIFDNDTGRCAVECDISLSKKITGKRVVKPQRRKKTGVLDIVLDMFSLNDDDDGEDFWDDDLDPVIRKIFWSEEYTFFERGSMIIYNRGNRYREQIERLEENEFVLGITREGILCASEDEYLETDIKYKKVLTSDSIELQQLHHHEVYSYCVVDGILIVHSRDKKKGNEKLTFWNTKTNKVYHYLAVSNLAIAQCRVSDDLLENGIKTSSLLNMQGVGRPKKHFIGEARFVSGKQQVYPRTVGERITRWNYPALVCSVILLALSMLLAVNFYDIDNVYEYVMDSLNRYGLQYVSCLLVLKIVWPKIMEWMKWTNIYDLLGTFSVVCILFLTCWAMNNDFSIVYFSVGTLTIILLPFFMAYAWNRPRNNHWTTIVCMGILSVYIVRMLHIGTQYHTGTYLLICFFVVLFSFIYIEKMRNGSMEGIILWLVTIFTFISVYITYDYSLTKRTTRVMDGLIELTGDLSHYGYGIDAESILWFDADIICNYPITLVNAEYGMVPTIVIICLILSLLYFMYKGAKKQIYPLDKAVCMTCTAFMVFQVLIGLVASWKVQLISPYILPFWGIGVHMQQLNMIAMAIYMAFYDAHILRGERWDKKGYRV